MHSSFFKIVGCILLLSLGRLNAQQRIIAECTINYSIKTDDTSSNTTLIQTLKSSTKTVYIKGNESRTDLRSTAFCQSVIYDKTTGKATILRELGDNKFITLLDNTKWMHENARFDALTIETTKDRKPILGYDCKKAIIHLKDGNNYLLYYTTSIVPSVKEFEYQFKDIPGLVLSYEASNQSGEKVIYTATKVNLSPVPASIFTIPKSGYRML